VLSVAIPQFDHPHRVVAPDGLMQRVVRPGCHTVRVHAVLKQQSHPIQVVPVGLSQQQRREAVVVEPAAVEQDAKNVVVPRFGNVVRRLFIVRVGAALKEQTRDAGVARDSCSSIDCAQRVDVAGDRQRLDVLRKLRPAVEAVVARDTNFLSQRLESAQSG
jgi:hypothetical protein